MKLMRVLHRIPGGAEACNIDLAVGQWLLLFRCRRNFERRCFRGELRDQRIEGGGVGLVGLVDLVDRNALRIEELQAAARPAFLQLLGNAKAKLPLREEDTKVDILADDEADMRAPFKRAIDALALMHNGFVARQRHHAAKRGHGGDNLRPFRAEPRHARGLAAEREKFRFRNAETGGDVAGAEIGLGGKKGRAAFDEVLAG